MNGQYILDERGEPVECDDLMTWAQWIETSPMRRVRQTVVGPYEISTIFLGLDHSWGGGPPILWETMIFKGRKWNEMLQRKVMVDIDGQRHHTRAEAIEWHEAKAAELARALATVESN